MRRAVIGFLALGGCNFVFGLDATKLGADAAPPIPPVPIHLALLDATLGPGTMQTAPVEVAFPDLVRLEASTLDGVVSQMLTADQNGLVGVPNEIATVPWRLVYQRQGGVVRELQNLPADAHVGEPLFGPVTRTAPAAGAGYTITSTGFGLTSHAINRVFTTGTWTEGATQLPPNGAVLAYDYSGATSMSGELGVPGATDLGTLVDYAITNGCRTSSGATEFPAGSIGPPPVDVSGTWIGTGSNINTFTDVSAIDTTDFETLGGNDGPVREEFGYLPSREMPAFTRPPDSNRSMLLRNPLMLVMRSCTLPYSPSAPNLVEPATFKTHLTRALHTEMVATRTLPGGESLINGAAYVVTDPGGANPTFSTSRSIAVASSVTLTPEGGAAADLFGAMDDVHLATRTGRLNVTWAKQPATGKADFWEVALLEVSNGGLVEKRIYTTTTPSLAIAGADLAASTTYVLRFTAFTGRAAAAASGDFRAINGDQAITIIHSRSFVTPP